MTEASKELVVVPEPLVSVIMPCYNSEDTIVTAVESVLSQDYSNLELIIVDDGSTDSTRRIVMGRFGKDARVMFLLNQGEHGVAHARNMGLRAARGLYICFLDSDDYYLTEAISRRVSFAGKKGLKLVFGPYERLLPNGRLSKVRVPEKVCYSDMLKKNHIGNLTGLYDSEFFGKVFQKDIRHEDYLMWCHMLQQTDFAHSVGGEPLGVYRVANSSLSGNKLKASFWRWKALRDGLKIRFLPATYYLMRYVISSILDRVAYSVRV